MTLYDDPGATYEDLDFLYDGMPAARAISVLAGSMDAAEDVTEYVDWETLRAVDNGSTGIGLITATLLRRLADFTHLADQSLLRIIDHALHEDTHRGVVILRRPIRRPGGLPQTAVTAQDIGTLLDDTFIASESRPAETMVARLTALWTTYASAPPLDTDDLSFIASIGGTLEAQDFAGVTLRAAIEATIAQASATADYHVDASGRLHVYTSEGSAAPYNINLDAPGVGDIEPEDLTLDYDGKEYANRVYIQGATPAASGYFSDASAIATDGVTRTRVIKAPDCETATMAQALATKFLTEQAAARARGEFSTTTDGWRSGQELTVTDADLGLTAEPFRVARVTTRFLRPGTSPIRRYVVEFGSARPQLGGSGAMGDSLGTGHLVSGQLGSDSNVYVTSEGVAVTDGSAVRARMGVMSDGTYGLEVKDGILGATANTRVTANGVVVNDGTTDRVTVGDIGSNYGLKVVASDGTTVIIDGESNMFKIQASGTLSRAFPALGTASSSTTVLSGLGSTSTIPAAIFLVTDVGDVTNGRFLGQMSAIDIPTGRIAFRAQANIELSGSPSGNIQIIFTTMSPLDDPGTTALCRYYVLEEAGI